MYSGLLVDVAVKTHMPEIPVPGGKLQPVPESAPSQVQKPCPSTLSQSAIVLPFSLLESQVLKP
jgi:hypothetical protein